MSSIHSETIDGHWDNSSRGPIMNHGKRASQHTDTTHAPTAPSAKRLDRADIFHNCAGEFLGTAILVIFGAGVNCQATLSTSPGVAPSAKGNYVSISFGWAVGIALGAWISDVGDINPAITLARAAFRPSQFSLRKLEVPLYILFQLLGGLVGAAVVYGNYFHAIDIFEGGEGVRTLKTASLFGTFALDYMTSASSFFSEFLATMMLTLGVFAVKDEKYNLPDVATPLALFAVMLGIATALGMETGFAINPARDLGPRLLTSMVGYGGQVYTFRNQYWLWCPVIAPIIGAQFGALVYDVFLYTGDSSIISRLIHRYTSNRNTSAAV
ncbi:aquaporin-like protein [Infundibulicybe gibba]|nr:aquaporin-like protein [Infundibulicybe gibba]